MSITHLFQVYLLEYSLPGQNCLDHQTSLEMRSTLEALFTIHYMVVFGKSGVDVLFEVVLFIFFFVFFLINF
jgi:hypothetical protein